MIDNLDALSARDDLLAVAAAWPALRARLTPTSATSEIRTPPGSKPPIDIGVSDLMRTVEERTRFYAQVLVEEEGWAPTTSTMPGLLEEVAARYGHFTHRSGERMALDFLDDAHEMRRMVSGLLAQTERPRWQGPCPEDECPGELYQRAGGTEARCRECGREVGTEEWRSILAVAFETRLMTPSELASALYVMGHTVPYSTLRRWVATKRLPEAEPGLYWFKDAAEMAARKGRKRAA